jgi:hypothetical protein
MKKQKNTSNNKYQNRYSALSDKKEIKIIFDYNSYFKEQEKLKLQDIENEKQYKPPNSWINNLIPIVF